MNTITVIKDCQNSGDLEELKRKINGYNSTQVTNIQKRPAAWVEEESAEEEQDCVEVPVISMADWKKKH